MSLYTVYDSELIQNFAGSEGGAIYACYRDDSVDANLTIIGSSFVENTADSAGSAVFMERNVHTLIDSSVFIDNVATHDSGLYLLDLTDLRTSSVFFYYTECIFFHNRQGLFSVK